MPTLAEVLTDAGFTRYETQDQPDPDHTRYQWFREQDKACIRVDTFAHTDIDRFRVHELTVKPGTLAHIILDEGFELSIIDHLIL